MSPWNVLILIIILCLLVAFVCLLRDSLSFDFNKYVIRAIYGKRRDDEDSLNDDGNYEKIGIESLSNIKNYNEDEQELEFIFFSDLHIETSIVNRKKILDLAKNQRDTMIIFGGDLVSKRRGAKKGLSFLRSLVEINKDRPIIVVRGNHDGSLNFDDLKETGVIPLNNQSIFISDKKKNIYQITGVDDARVGILDLKSALYTTSPLSPENFTSVPFTRRILIAHNPDTVLDNESKNFAFVFSGHFHDGQIRLPFRLEFKSLRKDKLPKNHIYNGFFVNSSTLAYISSGIGTVLFPLRFLTRAEICQFKILKYQDTNN